MINTPINPPSLTGYYLTYPWPDADPTSARVLHFQKESGQWSRNSQDVSAFYPVATWKPLDDEAPVAFDDYDFEIMGQTITVRATSRLNAALNLEAAMNDMLDAEGID